MLKNRVFQRFSANSKIVQTSCCSGLWIINPTMNHKKKGIAMIKHQAGLHKDVAKIFDGVWIPQTDNIQASVNIAYKDSGAFVQPKPLVMDNWPERVKVSKKSKQLSSPWSFFSPKARREKKRLSAISRHLLINMPD